MSNPTSTVRSEKRTAAKISTTVRLFDPDRKESAEIVDFSDHGMGLLLPVPVAAGAPIVVDYKGIWMLADVVYCNPQQERFRAGLRLRKALATQAAAQATQNAVAKMSSMKVGGFRLGAPR